MIAGVANVWMHGGDWVEFEADGGSVLTFQPEGSLDDAAAGLKDRGVEFPGEVSEYEWGRVAALRDPEGNEMQFYEPPKN